MSHGTAILPNPPARKALKPVSLPRLIRQGSLSRMEVRRKPGSKVSQGLLIIAGRAFPCVLGQGGLTARKREGDRRTPSGDFRLLAVLWRADRTARPMCRLPISAIAKRDGWCDAPADPCYNRPVNLPFRSSAETLWREDALYDICVVTSQNWHPRKRGGGSAIFLHLIADKPGTAGCIAMNEKTLRRLLATCGPKTRLIVSPGI